MRLKRPTLLAFAFANGKDPFALSEEARAELSLANPNLIDLKVQSRQWPVELPRAGARALLDGNADVRLDVRKQSATGSLACATSGSAPRRPSRSERSRSRSGSAPVS